MDIDFLPLLSRWAHILSAIVAVGGSFFMRLVLMPVAQSVLPDDVHDRLRKALIGRWQKFIHVCILLFLLSGFYNYLAVTRHLHFEQPQYHMLFGVKFLLALCVFALAIALTSLKPWSARLRANARLWLGLLVALAIAVVLISGVMRAMPVQRAEASPATIEDAG